MRSRREAWIGAAMMPVGLFLVFSAPRSGLCESGKGPQVLAQTKAETRPSTQLNVNRATVAELKTLPGIGEATAQRIVEYRKKNPPFRKLEELLIIRGISRNRLEQIRHRIRLD
ncbi:MAG TPA: helix-hairpin-helix domain-containing protein [Terriglobia bacterium]|nr:helix-hairpin-helix domain-containing protein [Terriglobia bacterium]